MAVDALPAGAEGLVLDAAEQQALLDGAGDMAGRGLREERDALLAAHFGSARGVDIAAGADRRGAERGLSP